MDKRMILFLFHFCLFVSRIKIKCEEKQNTKQDSFCCSCVIRISNGTNIPLYNWNLPIVEYESIIWSPYYNTHQSRIESIQKFFFCITKFWLEANHIDLPPYREILKLLNMNTLEDRRKIMRSIFILDIIQNIYNMLDFNMTKYTCKLKLKNHFKNLT